MEINVSSVNGYQETTPEQKIAAPEAHKVEAPKPDETAYQKLKEAVQRANAEAADYKRQLREKQTEAERAEAERAEREKTMQEELARYRTNERISGYQAKLMASGYDAETARVMATALPEGIGDDFFAAHKTFMDSKFQEMEAAALNQQPKLSVGNPMTGQTAEEIETAKLRKWMGIRN